MLESLDRDYKRDEDWCGTERANIADKPSFMVQLINKHNEQKEAFLKVSLVASAFLPEPLYNRTEPLYNKTSL